MFFLLLNGLLLQFQNLLDCQFVHFAEEEEKFLPPLEPRVPGQAPMTATPEAKFRCQFWEEQTGRPRWTAARFAIPLALVATSETSWPTPTHVAHQACLRAWHFVCRSSFQPETHPDRSVPADVLPVWASSFPPTPDQTREIELINRHTRDCRDVTSEAGDQGVQRRSHRQRLSSARVLSFQGLNGFSSFLRARDLTHIHPW